LFGYGDSLHLAVRVAPHVSERAEWTSGIRRRDASTLEAVVRDAMPGLLRAARAAGVEPEGVEDVVHDTLLVFLRRAEEFDGRARAATWMQGILARKVLETRRLTQREEPSDDIDAVFARQFDLEGSWGLRPAGVGRGLAEGDVQRALAACLATLPPRQRDAFVLREVDGVETDALCKILNVTANNLGVLLFRARVRLRACLEKKGLDGSADADL
jgi:RNA polymerase sigma-70 factor, ECF subfamily